MRILVSMLVLVFVSQGLTFAQDARSPVHLSGLIKEALNNNPQILAAKARYEAARARVAFFRNVPDPMVEYGYDKIIPSMIGADAAKPMKTLSVTQRIPFPTKLFLERKAARQEMDAQKQDYEETRQRVIEQVKDAYASLFVAQRKIAFTKDDFELAGQMAKAAEVRYSANRDSQIDLLRAQAEQEKIMVQQKEFEQDRVIAVSLLASLLNKAPQDLGDIDTHENAKGEDLSEENVIKRIKQDRPELKSFRAILDQTRTKYSLSKQSLLPDITLTYQHQEQNGSFGRGQWAGMVGFTIPLWFWGKQAPEIVEARADLRAAQADYQAEENTAIFEGRSALAKVKAAREVVELYEKGILPRAESVVVTDRVAYEASTGDFTEYIAAFKALRDFQMEYAQALAGLAVAKADLDRAIGGDIVSKGE
ncbi:MAG: TolC family protein [Candidatus Omnitrophica bacterium]|nr:TolC family protein [Candidatus Omnitrophota bacterium]